MKIGRCVGSYRTSEDERGWDQGQDLERQQEARDKRTSEIPLATRRMIRPINLIVILTYSARFASNRRSGSQTQLLLSGFGRDKMRARFILPSRRMAAPVGRHGH